MDASTGVPEPRARVGLASENRRALSAFLAWMPIQGRYAELLVQAHVQANAPMTSVASARRGTSDPGSST